MIEKLIMELNRISPRLGSSISQNLVNKFFHQYISYSYPHIKIENIIEKISHMKMTLVIISIRYGVQSSMATQKFGLPIFYVHTRTIT